MSSDYLSENREALKRLLKKHRLTPRRSSGQHFLVDSSVVDDLVQAGDVRPSDTVLEIGPGLGVVTDALVDRGARVVAVELDQQLAALLRQKYQPDTAVHVVEGNALSLKLDDFFKEQHYKLVASLPYNITSLVLRNFLERQPRPSLLALVVQREVAERAVAPPGEMSLLSVAVQYLGRAEIIRIIPRESFYPIPQVESAIIQISVPKLPPEDERKKLFQLAKIGFSSRRKMLRNNLEAGLRLERQSVEQCLEASRVTATARPQELSVQQWLILAKKLL